MRWDALLRYSHSAFLAFAAEKAAQATQPVLRSIAKPAVRSHAYVEPNAVIVHICAVSSRDSRSVRIRLLCAPRLSIVSVGRLVVLNNMNDPDKPRRSSAPLTSAWSRLTTSTRASTSRPEQHGTGKLGPEDGYLPDQTNPSSPHTTQGALLISSPSARSNAHSSHLLSGRCCWNSSPSSYYHLLLPKHVS